MLDVLVPFVAGLTGVMCLAVIVEVIRGKW